MPNVRAHDMITVVSGIALLPVCWLALPDSAPATILTLPLTHLVSGLIFSPDLDIAAANYRRWGPLRLLWWPYQELVPHRSWLSHGLVVGPLLRLGYFLGISCLLLWCLLTVTGNAALWLVLQQATVDNLYNNQTRVLAFLLGFVTGGAAHTIPDRLSTSAKRTLNQWARSI